MTKPPSVPRAARVFALAAFALAAPSLATDAPVAVGPDVTVYSLSGFQNYGAVGGVRAYALGTTSCNVGDSPVNWCDTFGGCAGLLSNQHPVIAQGIYRLKNGRFEQIGMSWLKHGFLATNTPAGSSCVGPGGQQCTSPPRGGDELGVGCTDTYGPSLNGSWSWMGPRSEVNATTGLFPFPASNGPESQVIDQRIQIRETDLDPALNPGALYWGEGHYVADNDAIAGNAFNNASYRSVSVGPAPSFELSFTGSTIREKTAVAAWVAADPAVEYVPVDFVTGTNPPERFEVARKVTEPAPGQFHYEYAIRNMNSDRAARRLMIQFSGPVNFTNAGFKDVDHHSGEPYDPTDWTVDAGTPVDTIAWSGGDFSVDPDGNALRWATMYNFWFDADLGPDEIVLHRLDLFKPGTPSHVDFSMDVVTFGLQVAVAGQGSVTSSPAGIDCPGGDCSHDFLAGTPVTLTATPASGWNFAGWSGSCTGTGGCTVTMTQIRSVTATFEPDPVTFGLGVTVTGQGSVTSSPAGIDCPGSACSHAFLSGTPVTLTAAAAPGWEFSGWSGDCFGTGFCNLTMDAAKAATATFSFLDPMPFVDGFESGNTSEWSATFP